MIVAAIQVTASLGFAKDGFLHRVEYTDLDVAKSEYERVAKLITDIRDNKNDLPRMLELEGVQKFTIPLESVCSVGLEDFAWANEHRAGMHDAYPNLRQPGR